MINKRLIANVSIVIVFVSAIGLLLLEKKETPAPSVPPIEKKEPPAELPISESRKHEIPTIPTRKVDFNIQDKKTPLSAIYNLAQIPQESSKNINTVLEKSKEELYYLYTSEDKATIITALPSLDEENPIKRHNFNLLEISLNDGVVLNNDFESNDSDNDKWTYDENELPLTHIHYNKNNEIDYSEFWNYSEEDPIKYKKIDKDGVTVSVRKEIIENDVNLREENIFYNPDGSMDKNVSFNYDGINLTRFTYYNSKLPEKSVVIMNEYSDGVKEKETIYSSDYKVKNVFIPKYFDDELSQVEVRDNENKMIEKLVKEN